MTKTHKTKPDPQEEFDALFRPKHLLRLAVDGSLQSITVCNRDRDSGGIVLTDERDSVTCPMCLGMVDEGMAKGYVMQ